MSYKTFNKFLLTAGFISLLHTAYSAAIREFEMILQFIKKKKTNSINLIHRSNIFTSYGSGKNECLSSVRCKCGPFWLLFVNFNEFRIFCCFFFPVIYVFSDNYPGSD